MRKYISKIGDCYPVFIYLRNFQGKIFLRTVLIKYKNMVFTIMREKGNNTTTIYGDFV